MPQIDVTVFFFEMTWFFLFFIVFTFALVHFFLVPNAEVIFTRLNLQNSCFANLLQALYARPIFLNRQQFSSIRWLTANFVKDKKN